MIFWEGPRDVFMCSAHPRWKKLCTRAPCFTIICQSTNKIYVIFCFPGTCNSKGPAPTIFFILGVLNTWIRHGDLPKYHIFFVQISLFLEVGNRMFNSKLKKKFWKFFRIFARRHGDYGGLRWFPTELKNVIQNFEEIFFSENFSEVSRAAAWLRKLARWFPIDF